jgi:hypothetical protein
VAAASAVTANFNFFAGDGLGSFARRFLLCQMKQLLIFSTELLILIKF